MPAVRRLAVLIGVLALSAGVVGTSACSAERSADAKGVGATGAPGPSAPGGTAPSGTGAAEPVVKQVLAQMADPPGAPGRTLTLIRYTIAPSAKLSAHVHPGVQLASIESGTLTYTVESGRAVIRRAGGTTEQVDGPAITQLRPGDAVQESGDMVHFGANDTGQPVVITASLLTETGKDLAVVTGSSAPPASR